MHRLDPKACAVLVIDVQEKLAAAMPKDQLAALVRATGILVEAAGLLGARVAATEQYPQGLGHTLPEIAEPLARVGAPVVAKIEFDACACREFQRVWADLGARTAVVVGMETHVCVFQTVRELAARGVEVHVPIDGVASRRDDHRAAGLDLCRSAGAVLTTAETVVFDWLGKAGTDAFKQLSKRIR